MMKRISLALVMLVSSLSISAQYVTDWRLVLPSFESYAYTSAPVEIGSEEEFYLALNCGAPVVAMFTATWSGPSKYLTPSFNEWANSYPNMIFAFVDVDKFEGLVVENTISQVPTGVFFINGQEVDRIVGANIQLYKEKLQIYSKF